MATDQSTQIVREAPEIEARKLGLLDSAKYAVEQANQNPVPGYQVAGMSPEQASAIGLSNSTMGAHLPYVQAATTAMGQGAGALGESADILRGADTRNQYIPAQEAMNRAAQQFTPDAAAQYMNPYMQQVLSRQMDEMRRQQSIADRQLLGNMIKSGAHGGSRAAVMRAMLERDAQTSMGNAAAQTLNQGYTTAQKAFEDQMNRYMQVGKGIGDLATGQYQIGSDMAKGLGAIGTQMGNIGVQTQGLGESLQRGNQADVQQMYNLGAAEQKQTQAELDAVRATNLARNAQGMQNIAYLSDIYKGAPSSQMSALTQTQAAASPFQQIAGLGTGILGTAAAANSLNRSLGPV
jgi:hypothetical protein